MPETKFKIRISIRIKLLVAISFLLLSSIFFLNLSAIKLFLDDKKAYIFDSQATSVALAGKEFTNSLLNSMSTLKLMIGYTDLSKALPVNTINTYKFYLENQRSLIGAELFSFNPITKTPSLAFQHFLPDAVDRMGLQASEIQTRPEDLLGQLDALKREGFLFRNISQKGQPPLLAIYLKTQNETSAELNQAIAVGYLNLQTFLSGVAKSFNHFRVIDKEGFVIFDTDIEKVYEKTSLKNDALFKEAWELNVNSAAKEYFNNNGVRTLGSFYKPGLNLLAISDIDYDKAMRATYALTEKFVGIGIGLLGFFFILALIFSKNLTRPLQKLFQATRQVSAGQFNVDIPISSRDEIGALSNAFISMSKKISELITAMVDKARVDQELEIAKTVQQSLFPPTHIQNDSLQIASHYQSASECGGDWWGYFRSNSKHIVTIADATGHGLPSALITATARSCFSIFEKLADEGKFDLNPADMLLLANQAVFDSSQGKIMMTCFVGVIDFDERTITYSSAAHNPPWLFSKSTDGFKMTSLVSKGPRLGEIKYPSQPYEVIKTTFETRDTLVLYTDGLLEGKNVQGAQYGKKQSRHIIEASLQADPQQLVRRLVDDFMEHNIGKNLDDDLTIAVARILR